MKLLLILLIQNILTENILLFMNLWDPIQIYHGCLFSQTNDFKFDPINLTITISNAVLLEHCTIEEPPIVIQYFKRVKHNLSYQIDKPIESQSLADNHLDKDKQSAITSPLLNFINHYRICIKDDDEVKKKQGMKKRKSGQLLKENILKIEPTQKSEHALSEQVLKSALSSESLLKPPIQARKSRRQQQTPQYETKFEEVIGWYTRTCKDEEIPAELDDNADWLKAMDILIDYEQEQVNHSKMILKLNPKNKPIQKINVIETVTLGLNNRAKSQGKTIVEGDGIDYKYFLGKKLKINQQLLNLVAKVQNVKEKYFADIFIIYTANQVSRNTDDS
jgi:hypothetical protein